MCASHVLSGTLSNLVLVTDCCLAQHPLTILLQTVKKASIEQLHFKGDPMHRPVMSREVGFLVQGFVKLSKWLNHQIGLDQPAQEGEMAETQIQVCP